MVDCHKCGQTGHVARDCQWEPEATGRPAWCGNCDRQTRLIDHGTYLQRCHQCWAWPGFTDRDGRAKGTRFHQPFPQHKLCGGCRSIIYAFDGSACGKHQMLAIDASGHRPPAIRKEDSHG